MLVQVCVDSREPPAIQQLAFGGVNKIVVPLDYPDSNGSYDLAAACDDGEMLVIERATPNDFLRKLRDDRLFPQLAQLRQQSRWCYLVITGEIRPGPNDRAWLVDDNGVDQQTGWAWTSVQGALLTAQEIGVHVVMAASNLDYERTVIGLSNRKRDAVRVTPARDTELLTEQEALLSALPGIGRFRAATLLKHCGSPVRALEWLACDAPEVDPIPGIGADTRRRVRRALQLTDDQRLTIWTRETVAEQEAIEMEKMCA